MIREFISKVVVGEDLTEAEMETAMDEIMTGTATPAQIGAFITALRLKGETVDEITGAARTMRAKATKVNVNNHVVNLDRDEINIEKETILDIVGTGGDTTRTFNVSTTTAFVVAGCGVTVAKHGNRSVSSKCGSADLLESLGVNLNTDPEIVEEAIACAPSRIPMYNRLGSLTMPLELGKVFFGSGSDTTFTIDIESGERRRATGQDAENMAKVVDAQDNFDFVMSMANPSDVPVPDLYLHAFMGMLRGSTKPIVYTAKDRDDMGDFGMRALILATVVSISGL